MADPRTILVCSCDDTMPIDTGALERGCPNATIVGARQLCRAELERFRAQLAAGAPLTVGCTQEAPLFREVAAERADDLQFVNLRETAGWSADAKRAGAKMAALAAVAALPAPEVPLVSLESDGVILIYGRDEQAVTAADRLKDHLDVTVLLTRADGMPPPRTTEYPIAKGTVRTATGQLGGFEVVVDDYALPLPSSRATLSFGAARDGAVSRCDILLDLSGGAPLFPGVDLRDGYLRADPGNPAAVLAAVLRAR